MSRPRVGRRWRKPADVVELCIAADMFAQREVLVSLIQDHPDEAWEHLTALQRDAAYRADRGREPAAGRPKPMAAPEPEWLCPAYGSDPVAAQLGALCFFAPARERDCAAREVCHTRLAAERQRVWHRIRTLAAEGDATGVELEKLIAGPHELLGGPHDTDCCAPEDALGIVLGAGEAGAWAVLTDLVLRHPHEALELLQEHLRRLPPDQPVT